MKHLTEMKPGETLTSAAAATSSSRASPMSPAA